LKAKGWADYWPALVKGSSTLTELHFAPPYDHSVSVVEFELNYAFLEDLSKSFPNIRVLAVKVPSAYDNPVVKTSTFSKVCTKATKLEISERITSETLAAVAGLPKLISLDWTRQNYAAQRPDLKITPGSIKGFRSLADLKIYMKWVADGETFFRAFEAPLHLRSLDLATGGESFSRVLDSLPSLCSHCR
jgi:hypothetical protein